jgi:hypothetical protein
MSQLQFKQYLTNQEVKQAPSIGEIQNTSKMIEEEITYKNEIKTSNADSLSFKQIWDKFQNEAKEKLTTTAQFMKKYRNAFYAGVAGTLLTIAPNVMNVNHANALGLETQPSTQFVQDNPEYVKKETKNWITNPDPTTEIAKANLKTAGLEKISDETIAKASKKLGLDLSRQSEVNELKPLIEVMNEDGTLNQEKVKQAGLKYLVNTETASENGTKTDSANSEKEAKSNNLFDGKTWNMQDETVKSLAKLACPSIPESCNAETLNNYIEKTLGYSENPFNLTPETLSEIIKAKTAEPLSTPTPPVTPTPSPKASETPAAESDGGTDEQAPKTSLTINTSKGKFVINSKIQKELNKLDEQGEQILGGGNVNVNSKEQAIYFTEPQLKSTVKKGFSSKATYSQRLLDRKNTILNEINPNNKAKVEDLQALDNILASVNEAKATEKNQAKRQQIYDQATIEIDKLEKKIANNQELKKTESNNWLTLFGLGSGVIGGVFGLASNWFNIKSLKEQKQLIQEKIDLESEIDNIKKDNRTKDQGLVDKNKQIKDLNSELQSLKNQSNWFDDIDFPNEDDKIDVESNNLEADTAVTNETFIDTLNNQTLESLNVQINPVYNLAADQFKEELSKLIQGKSFTFKFYEDGNTTQGISTTQSVTSLTKESIEKLLNNINIGLSKFGYPGNNIEAALESIESAIYFQKNLSEKPEDTNIQDTAPTPLNTPTPKPVENSRIPLYPPYQAETNKINTPNAETNTQTFEQQFQNILQMSQSDFAKLDTPKLSLTEDSVYKLRDPLRYKDLMEFNQIEGGNSRRCSIAILRNGGEFNAVPNLNSFNIHSYTTLPAYYDLPDSAEFGVNLKFLEPCIISNTENGKWKVTKKGKLDLLTSPR